MIITIKFIRMVFVACVLSVFASTAFATKGIYLMQYSLENTAFITNIIKHAKASGIDTFVIDMELPSKRYQQNIALVKEANIKYVARIIMFPGGANPDQLMNTAIWEKKYNLVKQAIAWGADEIQLDYIRYNTKQKPSPQNAKDVLQVIAWFKERLAPQKIPLQVDVFGIASFGESKYIGQNIKMFSETVNTVCPMVYPSHYVPFAEHYATPYATIYDSLRHLKNQFGDTMPIKLVPYIELSNYHYPNMSHDRKIVYIKAQIRAVHAAGADGWYAWSPHNRYDNLFAILESQPDELKAVADANYHEGKPEHAIEEKPTRLAREDVRQVEHVEESKKSTGFSWAGRRAGM